MACVFLKKNVSSHCPLNHVHVANKLSGHLLRAWKSQPKFVKHLAPEFRLWFQGYIKENLVADKPSA